MQHDQAIQLAAASTEVLRAASNTWSQIGSDWMECHEGPLEDSDVAEAVFDADRITTFNPNLSPQALEYIKQMVWPEDMYEMCHRIR